MERANSVRQDHRHQCRGPRSSNRTPLYRSPHKHSWSGTMREEKDHRQRRLNNTCHYSFSNHSRHNESYHSHSRTDKRSSVRHESRHRSQRQHTRTSSRNQSPPSSGLILNPQPPVQSTVQMTSTLCLIHVMMTEFVLQSSAHHLIDVIIINMINVIINMKNICHLRGITIIKIGKFIK